VHTVRLFASANTDFRNLGCATLDAYGLHGSRGRVEDREMGCGPTPIEMIVRESSRYCWKSLCALPSCSA